MKDRYFLPSIRDKVDLEIHRFETSGSGNYMEPDWSETVLFKCEVILRSIRDNPGDILVYSDVDIIFLAPFLEKIRHAIKYKDIICQQDDPYGNFCTGFFVMRANRLTLKLWEMVRDAVKVEGRNQLAFNRIIRSMKDVRGGFLPPAFFGAGTFKPVQWKKNQLLYIPGDPVMFHANWIVGVNTKEAALHKVKQIAQLGRHAIYANNLLYKLVNRGRYNPAKAYYAVKKFNNQLLPVNPMFSKPRIVHIDASPVCQLKCRTCPTARGATRANLGSGMLAPHDFRKFLEDHPWVTDIELSNWGEVFLNPALGEIFRIGFENQVILNIKNGANLNYAGEDTLEDLVRYRVREITCSIDGATQEVYSNYRVNGNIENVLANIRKINAFKEKYNSPYPALTWQFVAFSHNEHEIEKAALMAEDLKMSFRLKLSWDDLYFESYNPAQDKEKIRSFLKLDYASRQEYEEKYGKNFVHSACLQMWKSPRINADGKLLGCTINYWDHFGNVFEEGLQACMESEKMQATRQLLMGMKVERKDIPCYKCKVYKSMVKTGRYISESDLGV